MIINYRKLPTQPVERCNLDKDELYSLYQSLGLILQSEKYPAIAAPQIGMNIRMFVMRGVEEVEAVINPIIVDYSDETEKLPEVNATYFMKDPVKVERHKSIRVRYTNLSGEVVTKSFLGLTAKYFQSMMDILDGIPLRNRINRYHFERIQKYN